MDELYSSENELIPGRLNKLTHLILIFEPRVNLAYACPFDDLTDIVSADTACCNDDDTLTSPLDHRGKLLDAFHR